jgi:hypothetical protein
MPKGSGGLFVSGGNGKLCRISCRAKSKAKWDIRKKVLQVTHAGLLTKERIPITKRLIFWIGTDAIRRIDMNKDQQIDIQLSRKR